MTSSNTPPDAPAASLDPNRQHELKKMLLCEACAGIQRNWRRAPGQRRGRDRERGGSCGDPGGAVSR
jgi:hypothetical protein